MTITFTKLFNHFMKSIFSSERTLMLLWPAADMIHSHIPASEISIASILVFQFVCYNHHLQMPTEIFFGVQIRWLFQWLYNLPGRLVKPSLGRLGCTLGNIVLRKCPRMPKFQLRHRQHDIFSQDSCILDLVHFVLHTLEVSRDRRSKAGPGHHWVPAMLHHRQFLFALFFLLQT